MDIKEPVNVAGDGRCDSPGHNALFGLYSLMDTTTKKIVAATVIKVCSQFYNLINIYHS